MTRAEPVLQGHTSVTAPDGGAPDGQGVGIAIVDTGIDGTHPDLAYKDAVQRNLRFFYDGAVEMEDTDATSGHGTAVAGTAAGRGYRDEYRGLAPGATLYGLGVGDAFSVFWSLQAFDWVLSHHDKVDPPIKVVVNSWGSTGHQYDVRSPTAWYTDQMVQRGITVVYAAGNGGQDGTRDTTSPECNIRTEGVLCVGAYRDGGRSTRDGHVASFSSRGDPARPATWPDLVAPGERITTTLALSGATAASGVWIESPSLLYTTLSGTSLAAPMVGAAAAVLYELDPHIAPKEVERILERSAYAFDGRTGYASGDPRFDGSTPDRGHGLLDLEQAVALWAASGTTDTTTSPGSTDDGSGSGATDDGSLPLEEEEGLVDDTVDTIEEVVSAWWK